MPIDMSSQDRVTALETLVEHLAGEVTVLQDALRVSQARIAKLEELIAHRPACGLHDDPCRSQPGSNITTRFVYQSRNLDLLSLLDEVLHMIIDQVATLDFIADDEDSMLPVRYCGSVICKRKDVLRSAAERFAVILRASNTRLDRDSLVSLSCTSKAMQQHVMPALWRHITVDSPARMLRLTKAVKYRACGRHVRSIEWHYPAIGPYTLKQVRAALLDLSQNASAAHLPPLDDSAATSVLTEEQSIMFAAHMLVVAFRELTALQALLIESLLLSVVLCLQPEGHLPNQITHVCMTNVSETRRTEEVLSQNTFIATQALQMLGPHHRNVLDLFQRAPQQRQFQPLHSSWSGELALHVSYEHLVMDASDAAMAIATLQALLDSAAGLRILFFYSDGTARIRPEAVIPFVIVPVTLKIVHFGERSNSALDVVAAMSHNGLQYLRIVYRASNLAPEALPPSLTVLKLEFGDDLSFKTIASILLSLCRNLEDERYPKTLAYIGLNSSSLRTLARRQTLAEALFMIIEEGAMDADFQDFTSLLSAVLALDDTCRERGIELCGPKIAKPLLGPRFRETLPYKLMGQVVANLNSIEGGAAT